jgi:hypothetical protein
LLLAVSATGCEEETSPIQWPFALGAEKPYLGAIPPGDEPVVFAPGIVSVPERHEMGITFSPDGREVYFARSEGEDASSSWSILVSTEENGTWSLPEKASFSLRRDFAPHMAPDGKQLFFFSMDANDAEYREGTYLTKRLRDGWSTPVFFHPGYCITAALDGSLYSSYGHDEETSWDIMTFRPAENGFTEPEALVGGANSDHYDAHAVIAPDGSFVLFDSARSADAERSHIHVSFRLNDGTWSRAVSLGEEINASQSLVPSLSPDGKFIFFSREGDIWWADADIIERLKKEISKD